MTNRERIIAEREIAKGIWTFANGQRISISKLNTSFLKSIYGQVKTKDDLVSQMWKERIEEEVGRRVRENTNRT